MSDKPSSFASLFEAETQAPRDKRTRPPALGERVRAEVVQIGRESVFVELEGGVGKRVQAYMHLADLRAPDGELTVKVGDSLEAVIVEADAKAGEYRLGRSMGRPQGLEELERAFAASLPVEGKVTGVNKGGLEVEIANARAFCPISQADKGYLADPKELIGRSLEFLITEFREGGKRIVVSRRALLERQGRERAEETRKALVVGAVLRGTVTAVREFGAFVDLGGVEGLLPNAELSYERGATAAGVLNPGDNVEVQIRDIKDGLDKRGEKTTKITLSLKALSADPWDDVAKLAPVGRVLRGQVVRVMEFGGFLRVAPGLEGLLHISELGGQRIEHASAALKVGDTMNVIVRSVDREARKIALVPAPDGLEIGQQASGTAIQIGSLVTGTVDRVEPYGVFLQVEGTRGKQGRGLIPNAELATQRGADTRKLFPLGTKLTAKVLETGDGKLKLSIKALKEDEERADFDGFRASAGNAKLGTLADKLGALLNKKS